MSGVSWKQRYSCFVFQIMKRNLNNVKRMTSHPVYQYCKCQFETCSSSLHSPHPLSDAENSVLSVCCLTFLSICMCLCMWTYIRYDGGSGRQCQDVWMEETSAAHLFQTSRQRESHTSVFQLPGKQGARTHTCTRSVLSICAVVLIHLRCAASVELLTERASSVCGRSTRHHPTLNLTWWGHLLCPHHCKVAHIYSKYTFKSIILVLFLLTELAVSL